MLSMTCPECGHDTGMEASVINFLEEIICPECRTELIVVGGDTEWYLGCEMQNPYILERKDTP
jgi:ssDNA-binding Zn-finger/Zn-ribbon topoisomerase 1